jgi:hypothetical protein
MLVRTIHDIQGVGFISKEKIKSDDNNAVGPKINVYMVITSNKNHLGTYTINSNYLTSIKIHIINSSFIFFSVVYVHACAK